MSAGIFYRRVHAYIIIFACLGVLPNRPTAIDDRSYISFLSPRHSSQSSRGSLEPSGIVGHWQAADKQRPRREQSNPEPESATLPAFLKQSFAFPPDSTFLDIVSREQLRRIAGWLRQHRRVRVLVVGFCDPLGSENCTHALAAQRAGELGRFLLTEGVDASQITGMVGWEKADPVCRAETPGCQQQNRRARVFVSVSEYADDVSSQKTPTKTVSGKGGQ